MTAVLVHGVPETARVWDPLVDALERDDVVCLSLPGFGTPLPDGFAPTMQRYAEWLADELASYDEVDLVAHDWGALLSMRVLADRPPNVRTWALDTGDLGDDFQWHSAAKAWQTPDDGEALMEAWLSLPVEDRGDPLLPVGAPPDAAAEMGVAIDETMATAILGLYRSAVDIADEWGPGIDRWGGRGLVVCSGKDPFRKRDLGLALAERTGAQVLDLPEAGHWWMRESPVESARALERLWAGG